VSLFCVLIIIFPFLSAHLSNTNYSSDRNSQTLVSDKMWTLKIHVELRTKAGSPSDFGLHVALYTCCEV